MCNLAKGEPAPFQMGSSTAKLKTRILLKEFVRAGAPAEILYVAKPHIGTFRLVGVVEKMRQEIIRLGGEIRFVSKVVGFRIEAQAIQAVQLEGGEEVLANHVVLALGHSARDTFKVLFDAGVFMEAKAFSVGFRIEHPQSLIDRARLGPHAGNSLIGAADYKLVHHAKNGRTVYSFCMSVFIYFDLIFAVFLLLSAEFGFVCDTFFLVLFIKVVAVSLGCREQ